MQKHKAVLMNFHIDIKRKYSPSSLKIGQKGGKRNVLKFLSNSNRQLSRVKETDISRWIENYYISKLVSSWLVFFLSFVLFLEMLWPMYARFCSSMRRHSRTVLRPDEVIRSGRITLHDKVSLPRRLCRQGLFQYRGEFENSFFPPCSHPNFFS